MQQMKTDIELIKQKSEFIEEKLQTIVKDVASIKLSLANNDPLKKEDLVNHAIEDRWLFGVLIAILLGIFAKVLHG